MKSIHNICSNNIFIEVPVDNELETKIARINWIQLLEEPFYVAGITFMENPDNDPYNGGSSEWILQKDTVVGLKAIMCNLYWSEQQSNEIKKAHALWNNNVFFDDSLMSC